MGIKRLTAGLGRVHVPDDLVDVVERALDDPGFDILGRGKREHLADQRGGADRGPANAHLEIRPELERRG